MKIKPEHIEHMQTIIHAHQAKYPNTKEQYKTAGLSTARYRWDVLHATGLTPWICAVLYPYLNDAHIETALKHIIPE
jgi:uncharacterized membrane protein